MKTRLHKYLTADAEPDAVKKGNVRADLKRMTAWLRARGHPSGFRRKRVAAGLVLASMSILFVGCEIRARYESGGAKTNVVEQCSGKVSVTVENGVVAVDHGNWHYLTNTGPRIIQDPKGIEVAFWAGVLACKRYTVENDEAGHYPGIKQVLAHFDKAFSEFTNSSSVLKK